MRLTKRRLAELETALSIDDVLYEKFRRLNGELQKEWRKLYRAKQIVRVVQRKGNINYVMQIQDVQVSPEGTFVVVR